MGEYWKPVNLTRREYIHPHHVNCGLKLAEWNYPGSPVLKLMKRWAETDDTRAISDYGSVQQLSGQQSATPAPEYERIEEDFIEVRS